MTVVNEANELSKSIATKRRTANFIILQGDLSQNNKQQEDWFNRGVDFYDVLLETRYEDTGEGMSTQQLIDEIKILFIAGHETTANAMTFTMHLLGNHPEIQQKILDELIEIESQTDDIIEQLQKTIRNLVQSSKEPNVLLVAARDGIYRTKDRGANWERITPENDPELRGFHSVGVDPRDSNVIYVGTWHRPWKTTDGGLTWKLAGYKENGVIDDSDVFSIRIDETNPDIVLISACSGIYRTTNAANDWTKIQGVPFTSRRTHTIYQHPTRPEMIFAGTTEGLWRTVDNGKNWALVSSRRQVINAVAVHPEQPDRVYIGTEDGGILISTNGGESFEPSNLGFINRQIRVVMHDRTERGRVYAGVIFDSANGGLFVSEDNGLTWQQSSRGMGISDVYSLQQSTERPEILYAGTNKGLYRSEDRGLSWAKVIKVTEPIEPQPTKKQSATPKEKNIVQKRSQTAKSTKATTSSKSRNQAAKKPKVETPPASPDETIDLNNQIYAIAQIFPRTADDGAGLIAATWDGLFITRDEKKGWKQLKFDNATYPYFNVVTTSRAVPGLILVGTVDGLFVSRDNGESFVPMPLAPTPRRVQSIVFDPREPATIYAGTNDGLFITNNGGQSWEQRGNGLRTSIDTSAVLVNPNNPDEIYVGVIFLPFLLKNLYVISPPTM